MTSPIDPNRVAESNATRESLLRSDYEHVCEQLDHME